MSGTDTLYVALILGGYVILNIYGMFYWRQAKRKANTYKERLRSLQKII